MRSRIIVVAIMFVIALSLLIADLAYGQEIEKRDFEMIEKVEPIELLSEPDEVSTTEVPVYMLRNANMVKDDYYNLIETTNSIIGYMNVEVIPEYNRLYESYEITYEMKEEYKRKAERRGTLAVIGFSAAATGIIGAFIYGSVAN
jgi:preprotein translocase subunit SecE